MQQQQQQADYDLLAVFGKEAEAEVAVAKLQKEGYREDEIYQLESGSIGKGEFRTHGPNQERREFFLQTRRGRPNPALILLFAIIGGLLFGGLSFAASFALPTFPLPTLLIIGIVIGVVLGAIPGLFRRGRVQGNIGQDLSKVTTTKPQPVMGERTIVALRFPDSENISRKSRARAILINNGGKIDRSVGRRLE